jgi:hypothetical protein
MKCTKLWLAAALAALAFSGGGAAHAETTGGGVGGGGGGATRSAFVFRHCLRSTPTTAYGAAGFDSFDNYSSPDHRFPEWPVPVYQCLPQGLRIVQALGAQLNATLPGDGRITLRVDTNAKRDNDTAASLLAGLGPPASQPQWEPAPEIFNPTNPTGSGVCAPLSRQDAIAALTARFKAVPVPAGHQNRLDRLQAVLGTGVAPPLSEISDSVKSNGYFTGGSSMASEFAEAFLMQQGGGLKVAWGGATEDMVYDFLAAHIYYRGVNDRVFVQSARSHSWMATEMVGFLKGSGQSADAAVDSDSLGFVGHDADLDALAALFGLSWHALPFPANSTTPGSALRLDLVDEGKSVQASIVYQQFNSDNPPMRTVPATWNNFGKSTVSVADLEKWMAGRIVQDCVPK